jgi:hypothetical protein
MYKKSLTETDINSIRSFLLKVEGRQSKSQGKVPRINKKSEMRYVADGKHHLSIKPAQASQSDYQDNQGYQTNPIYNKYKSMLKNIMKK